MPQDVTKVNFTHSINSSVQIGDHIFWTPLQTIDVFSYISHEDTDGSVNSPINLGVCLAIGDNYILCSNPTVLPTDTSGFITCHKNVAINETGTKGYYADVLFKNNSNTKAELFTVGSEISLSSK